MANEVQARITTEILKEKPPAESGEGVSGEPHGPLRLKSPAFRFGETLPQDFTREGANISPPLEWSHVPEGTREFVLLCEDPDAPGFRPEPFVHWVAYGISPNVTLLPRGLMTEQRLLVPVALEQGENSYGTIGYDGPEPPVGDAPHRYFFRLYALSALSGLRPGLPRPDVLRAIRPLILAEAGTMGRYQRKKQKAA